jgi:hypothetical protein
MTRIANIQGTTVTIERPLPWDLYNGYNPIALHAFKPALANIGVEGFSMTFKSGHYNGACAECVADLGLTINLSALHTAAQASASFI